MRCFRVKNIFAIFRDDIKGLSRNILALIIALGLCILPSLYAWFNIYSNWDPYANTSNVPIAVVSEDAGYEKDDGTFVNMGDQVLDNLHENTSLGWAFPATAQEAIDGVYSGEYYAALVMGEDFSSSMYNCIANGMEHPKITYYENQKKNAIATKITDTGSSTLQASINEEFIDVVVTTLSESIDELAGEEGEGSVIDELMSQLRRVEDNLVAYDGLLDSFMDCNESLSDTVLSMKDLIPKLNAAITSSVNGINKASSQAKDLASGVVNSAASTANTMIGTSLNAMAVAVTATNNALNAAQTSAKTGTVSPELGKNLTEASNSLGTIAGNADKVVDTINGLSDSQKDLLSQAGVDVDDLKKTAEAASKTAKAAQTATSKAATTASKVDDKVETVTGTLSEINKQIVSTAVDEAVAQLPNFNQKVYADLSKKVMEAAGDVNSSVQSIPSNVKASTVDVTGMDTVLDGVSQSLLAGNTALLNSKAILNTTTERLGSILDQIDAVEGDEKYEKFMEIMQKEPALYGEFLSQPVTVVTEPVYETANYGSAVTPFYTTLALWVGGIFLVSLMRVKVNRKNEYKDAKDWELFFGRYVLFFLMGQLQSFICVWGDIHILGVQCLEPGKFYLAGAVISFTFTLLIYTLTVSFGDIGKAAVVVIVVIQIAGSSGTYPIEILPSIFQSIYTFFPFPYAINAIRETVSGMYESDFWKYLGDLMIFVAASLAVGLVIRVPFMQVNHYIEKRMEDTGLM